MHRSDLAGLVEPQASAVEELLSVLWPSDGAARAWAEQFAADEVSAAAEELTLRRPRRPAITTVRGSKA